MLDILGWGADDSGMTNYGNLVRYGGEYLIRNYLEGRMSAASIYDFNDPFELHHRPGLPPTENEKRQRARQLMNRNQTKYEMLSILRGAKPKKGKKSERVMQNNIRTSLGEIAQTSIETQRERSPRIFNQTTKVICCSKASKPHSGEIPMWGYYAECHRGIRVHYTPDFYIRNGILTEEIEYKKEPIEFGFPELSEQGMYNFVSQALRRKSFSWAHEEEVRLMVHHEVLKKVEDGTITKTIRWWIETELAHVARVDLGIKFDNPTLVDRLKAEAPKVEIYQTNKNPSAYLCQYERVY